jgi:hypothetical protein
MFGECSGAPARPRAPGQHSPADSPRRPKQASADRLPELACDIIAACRLQAEQETDWHREWRCSTVGSAWAERWFSTEAALSRAPIASRRTAAGRPDQARDGRRAGRSHCVSERKRRPVSRLGIIEQHAKPERRAGGGQCSPDGERLALKGNGAGSFVNTVVLRRRFQSDRRGSVTAAA